MRGFLGLVIVGGVLCAGWFGVAQLLRMAPDHLHARGAEVQSIAVAGFPLRFDLALDRPALRAQGWSADAAHLSLPSYWPFRASGTLSGGHTLTRPGANWRMDGPDMPFAATVTPGLVLRAATLQGRELTLRGPLSGWLDSIALSLSPTDDPLARAVTLDMDRLDFGGLEILSATVRAQFEFTTPPRLTTRPSLQRVTVARARIDMGATQAEVSGTLERDADGHLNGELPLTVTNWQPLLAQMQQNGLLPPNQAQMVMMMAQGMSNGTMLSLPLNVRASVVYLGPLALFDLGRI